MRFVAVYQTQERTVPPTTEEIRRMTALQAEMARDGVMIATGGCLPTAFGARLRRAGGRTAVTDGPFAEAKEVIAGYAIMECRTKDEAIAWTRRFLEVAGDGVCEVRQLHDPAAGPDCVAAPESAAVGASA